MEHDKPKNRSNDIDVRNGDHIFLLLVDTKMYQLPRDRDMTIQ